jgi:hypothetical protein
LHLRGRPRPLVLLRRWRLIRPIASSGKRKARDLAVTQLELWIGSVNMPMNSSAPVLPSTIA